MSTITQKVEQIQSLQLSGDYERAAQSSLELCDMAPGNSEFLVSAALVHIGAGKQDEAIDLFLKGTGISPKNLTYKSFFLNTLLMAPPEKFNARVRDFILSCLRTPDQYETDIISILWHSQLISDPNYDFLNAQNHDFDRFMNTIGPDKRSLFGSPYFTLGISYLIVPVPDFEQLLTNLRKWILHRALEKDRKTDHWEVRLACAMARQCFLNEYIFETSADEIEKIHQLKNTISQGDDFLYAVIGCYEPLLPIFIENKINVKKLTKESSAEFQGLIQAQVKEPEEEIHLKRKISKIGTITDAISRKVQSQYEENPYPRWTGMISVTLPTNAPTDIQALQKQKIDILVAGCGTGSHVAKLRMAFPFSKIKAIDLSLSSLAYALRKTKEARYKNIKFFQCDILDVASMKSTFDLVDSSGVLHHMENPEHGLMSLLGVLKPNGFIKIGLYSQIARTHITDMQKMLRDAGLNADIDGIRAARKIIFSLPESHPAYAFFRGKIRDLYTASMLRDLLFHVQEHQFTIPQIREMIDKHNLRFISFSGLSPATLKDYKETFPDDERMTNLENWEDFEKKNPDTFLRMYQMWCQKAA